LKSCHAKWISSNLSGGIYAFIYGEADYTNGHINKPSIPAVNVCIYLLCYSINHNFKEKVYAYDGKN